MGQNKNLVFCGKTRRKGHLRSKLENNIKVTLRKIDGMAWIGLKWLSLETGDGTASIK